MIFSINQYYIGMDLLRDVDTSFRDSVQLCENQEGEHFEDNVDFLLKIIIEKNELI